MRTVCVLIGHAKVLSHCRRKLLPLASTQISHHWQSQNNYSTSTDVLPPPPANIAMKSYSPKIHKLVDDIGQLTLLEVSDLNELLKKTLNIKEAPMMAMAAAPTAVAEKAPEEEEAVPKREKVNYIVKMTTFDAGKKVQLIKEIKNVMEGMNLVQAKKFVESVPQVVKADITKDEAEKLKAVLAAVGAQIEIE